MCGGGYRMESRRSSLHNPRTLVWTFIKSLEISQNEFSKIVKTRPCIRVYVHTYVVYFPFNLKSRTNVRHYIWLEIIFILEVKKQGTCEQLRNQTRSSTYTVVPMLQGTVFPSRYILLCVFGGLSLLHSRLYQQQRRLQPVLLRSPSTYPHLNPRRSVVSAWAWPKPSYTFQDISQFPDSRSSVLYVLLISVP